MKKNLINTAILSIVLLVIASSASAKGKNILLSERERINSYIKNSVKLLSKNIPAMVSKQLQHTSSIALDLELRHIYTYINYTKRDLDLSKSIIRKKQNIMINTVCTTKDFQIYVQNNVTLSYYYYDSEGKFLYAITVKSSYCKQ